MHHPFRWLMFADLAVFVVAFVITLATTPLAAKVARRMDALSYPNERSVHTEPVPYLGGLAMFAGLLAGMALAWLLPPLHATVASGTIGLGVVVAATIVVIVMTIDDLRDISPPAKIAGLVLASSVLFLLGVTMTHFRVPFFGTVVLSSEVAPLVTAVWVILFCNAMNLIDGLDGLAAGVAAIAAVALFVFGARLQAIGLLEMDSFGPVLCAAIAGLSLGFLRWNFTPAKIYMGDAGAMLLGLLFAAATMLIGGRVVDSFSGQTFFFFAPLLVPLVILGIPILDTGLSFLRRLLKGQSFATADREHLHHRLLALGHGTRRSVLLIYAWTVLLALTVLVPTFTGRGNAIVPFALAGLALILYAMFHPGSPRRAGNGEVDAADAADAPTPSRRRGGKHRRLIAEVLSDPGVDTAPGDSADPAVTAVVAETSVDPATSEVDLAGPGADLPTAGRVP